MLAHASRKFPREDTKGYVQLIQQFLTVDLALPLAGYQSGVYLFDGARVLVTRSPVFIKTEQGNDWLIDGILRQMLGERQYAHFKAWCRLTDEA
jgi:hypothetical protein